MRFLPCLLALALPVLAEEGQGPVEPGPIVIGDLNMGTYWFGPKITDKHLHGKVVLVEIWGS